jgi:hypothetical protein
MINKGIDKLPEQGLAGFIIYQLDVLTPGIAQDVTKESNLCSHSRILRGKPDVVIAPSKLFCFRCSYTRCPVILLYLSKSPAISPL